MLVEKELFHAGSVDPRVLQGHGPVGKHISFNCVCILFIRSVSAGCAASAAQQLTNPQSAPDCLFWLFCAEVPRSPLLLVPVLAFLLNSDEIKQNTEYFMV